ncbi:MAG: hypothetical protein OXH28_02300 [bacterium]|nr:hypothetical protein [bacterium]
MVGVIARSALAGQVRRAPRDRRGVGAGVLACTLVLAAALASCGDDPGPPLSIETYASWCAESSLLAVAAPRSPHRPAGGFSDLDDAAEAVEALVENYESITPPAEVAAFHDQTLEGLRAAAEVIDETESFEDLSVEERRELSARELAELMASSRDAEDVLQDVAADLDEASSGLALAPGVRGPLTASGCLPLLQPTGARYVPAGPAIAISWEPVPGADSYTVYSDDFFDANCQVDAAGYPSFCDELAAEVLIPRFVHTRPAPGEDYWVTACNSWHCTTLERDPPAAPVAEPAPTPIEEPAASADPEPPAPPQTTIAGEISRAAFEAAAPEGYIPVTVHESGAVWGTPARFTSDSDASKVAYMLLGEAGGCDVADAQAARGATAYILAEPLGYLEDFESATACNSSSDTWESGWDGLRITHLRVFDDTSPTNVTEYVYDEETGRYAGTSPAPAARQTRVSPATGTQDECSRRWAREPYLPLSEAIRMCGGDVEALRAAHVEACATGDPAEAGLGWRTYAEFARDSEIEARSRADGARSAGEDDDATYYEDLADQYAAEATEAKNLAAEATTAETDRRAGIIAERGVASWPEACEQMTDELWQLDLYGLAEVGPDLAAHFRVIGDGVCGGYHYDLGDLCGGIDLLELGVDAIGLGVDALGTGLDAFGEGVDVFGDVLEGLFSIFG